MRTARYLGAAALFVLLGAAVAFAQDEKSYDEAARVTSWLLHFLTHWVAPIVAVGVAIYGVVHGMKKGEWGTSVICWVLGAGLILVVQLILNGYGLTMTSIKK